MPGRQPQLRLSVWLSDVLTPEQLVVQDAHGAPLDGVPAVQERVAERDRDWLLPLHADQGLHGPQTHAEIERAVQGRQQADRLCVCVSVRATPEQLVVQAEHGGTPGAPASPGVQDRERVRDLVWLLPEHADQPLHPPQPPHADTERDWQGRVQLQFAVSVSATPEQLLLQDAHGGLPGTGAVPGVQVRVRVFTPPEHADHGPQTETVRAWQGVTHVGAQDGSFGDVVVTG